MYKRLKLNIDGGRTFNPASEDQKGFQNTREVKKGFYGLRQYEKSKNHLKVRGKRLKNSATKGEDAKRCF